MQSCVTPLVSLIDPRSWVHRHSRVNSLLIPFYEIWENSHILLVNHKDVHDHLDFDGSIGLSSIGPDDYVISEAYFLDFVRFSTEHNFDFVIAWDVPTYVDWSPETSWKNTLYALNQVRRLTRQGINTIGLLNGSNRDHFERCADSLLSMGIDSVAIHASDYLRHRKDGLLFALFQDAVKVVNSRFKNALVIGATDPYLIRYEGKELLSKVSVSGFSWFIDAKQGRVYGSRGRINTNEADVLCSCSYCGNRELGALSRSTLDRAIHNFLMVQSAMEGRTLPNLEVFDIVHRGQKIVFVSDLHLGTKESLILDFLKIIRKEKPQILVLLGNIFDLSSYDHDLLNEHAKLFFRLLAEMGTEVYPVFGAKDKSLEAIGEYLRQATYSHDIHPNIRFSRYLIQEPGYYSYYVYKFYVIAKQSVSIRLADEKTIYAAHGPLLSPKFPSSEIILDGLSTEEVERLLKLNRCDYLVLGGYCKKIVREGKLYSLGAWQTQTTDQERLGLIPDLRGALVIDSEGIAYKEFSP